MLLALDLTRPPSRRPGPRCSGRIPSRTLAPAAGTFTPTYGAPGQPFGGEQASDPSSDATTAFRPSDENK